MDKFYKNIYGRNNKIWFRLILKNLFNIYMNCKLLFL